MAAWQHDNITYVGTTTPKNQAQHSGDGQPLWNGLDEDAAGEAHELGEGGPLIVNAVQFGLLERGRCVDDFGSHSVAISRISLGVRVSQGLTSSDVRSARHRGEENTKDDKLVGVEATECDAQVVGGETREQGEGGGIRRGGLRTEERGRRTEDGVFAGKSDLYIDRT